MNNVRGMTIKEFIDTLDVMRTIYDFDDDDTRIGDLHDIRTDAQRTVEIITRDPDTGVNIIMSKRVE